MIDHSASETPQNQWSKKTEWNCQTQVYLEVAVIAQTVSATYMFLSFNSVRNPY